MVETVKKGWGLLRTFRKIVRTIVWYAGLVLVGFYFVTGQLPQGFASGLSKAAGTTSCHGTGAGAGAGAI